MRKTAVMIDGGHLRVLVKRAGRVYNSAYIEQIAHACVLPPEEMYRVLYYDCAPYSGAAKLPISGSMKQFQGSDQMLNELAQKDYFAVRRGTLKFRGFALKKSSYGQSNLTDNNFDAKFEQKGVDMRIGLDMAIFASNQSVDLIILVTGDTDCIPALKHARRSGIQIAMVSFPKDALSSELLSHCDFKRSISWPP